MNKKRILVVSYLSPPVTTPRAIRLKAFASKWVQTGYSVDIVTYGDNVVETTAYGRVYRVTSKILKKLMKISNSSKQTANTALTQKRGNFKSKILSWIFKMWWKVFAWPDGNCLWIFPAVKKVKELMNSNSYDAVMSISTPFSGHVVALLALRKCKDVVWIIDSGDPFSLVPESPANNYFLYSSLNKFVERKCLEKCDYFSVTTVGTKKIYANTFSEYADKIVVIPPLYSADKCIPFSVEEIRKRNNGMIKINFIGYLYRKMRNPQNALNIFSKLFEKYPDLHGRCCITFFGSLGDCQDIFEEFTSKLPLDFRGSLPHDEIMDIMRSSSILLNLGNITSFQTPSKIIEYALSGRPVLNVAVIPDDSILPYFVGDDTFFNIESFSNITDKVLERLANFILSSSAVSREPEIINRIWEDHNIDKITDQYTALLN